MNNFTCPECDDTYAPHWRAPDASGLCRTCADTRDGRCALPGHPNHDSPCTFAPEPPGTPCRWCARPVPLDPTRPCPHCWTSLEDLPLADIKALFAADGTFNITPQARP